MGIEKWKIKEDSLMDLEEYGWCCTVMIDEKYIIHVYASTEKECLSRAKKICKVNEIYELLTEVYHSYGDPKMYGKMESLLKDLES